VFEGWGRRVGVVAIVLLAVVNVIFWTGFSRGKSSKSSFAQPKVIALPSGVATPPVPTTANPLALPTPAGPLRVSIVGDSIAAGHYASTPDKRFRALLLSGLSARGPVSPVEPAATGTSALSTAVALPNGVDLVVLEVGTDDMRTESVSDFQTAFGALVAEVHTASPHAELICAGTWSATGGLYDAVVQHACTGASSRYVPLQSLYDTPACHGPAGKNGYYGVSDGIAPNDDGHRAIAAALLGAVGLKLS
jgi:lysophospholipase L1-like esterase